jgi:HlyD family secretion protein
MSRPRPVDAYGLHLEPTDPPVRRVILFAVVTIAAFFAIFTAWGTLAPLDRAAIAPGELNVEGSRRVIQNLEGGIIAELAVAENDFVKAGQLLLRLDSTQTSAVVAATMMERNALLAENARLDAERDEADTITYPTLLLDQRNRPRIEDIIRSQNNLFESRNLTYRSRRSVYDERVAQAEAEIGGLESQLSSERRSIRLLRDERNSVKELVDLQLERRTRLLRLDREVAAVEGRIGELTAAIARTRQEIAQSKAELGALESEWRDKVVARQREVEDRLRQLEEQLRAEDDRNTRRAIYAPVDGQVVNLRHTASGTVVGAGEPILDIVPETEQIIINAYLRPSDRENVLPGLRTTTHLTPYSGRRVPRLSGSVTSISQDVLQHPMTGESYYLMTVHIDDSEVLSAYDIKLISGMPAEVFVKLGERSLVEYFIGPLRDSFYRAFRED